MINLSKKAADRFKINYQELPDREGDFWKVDVVMVGRIPILLIVHEMTLFTLIRRKADFRRIEDLAAEIRLNNPWYRYVGTPTYGRNTDRMLTGSITEMKRTADVVARERGPVGLELAINSNLYSYLGKTKEDYGTPLDAVEEYARGNDPRRR